MVKLLLLVVGIVLHLMGKFSVNGDDGNDLFSSTDDMKKLFVKEIQFSGKNCGILPSIEHLNIMLKMAICQDKSIYLCCRIIERGIECFGIGYQKD